MMRKIAPLYALAPIVAVLVAAGCGGSSYSGASSSPSAASAPAASSHAGYGYGAQPAGTGTSASASGAAKVGAGKSAIGQVVVNGTTRTLYVFAKDHNGLSACYGACASYWPPLLSKGRPVALGGTKQALVGTTRRTDGAEQVTYGGRPVYEYVGDTKPGQTTGEGLTDFGAAWDAISPTGEPIQPGQS
jgi:predicted lipoprotein with Yx(FWY)xxD motif